MFSKLSALALFLIHVSALKIEVPFKAKQGATVLLGFTISPGDPTNVDIYLNLCLNDQCSGSQKTYSVAKNVVIEPVVPEVIPMDVTPKFFYQFVASKLGGNPLDPQDVYAGSNTILIE